MFAHSQTAFPVEASNRPLGQIEDVPRIEDVSRIRVLCVDDHPLVWEGIGTVINSQPDMSLVASASNGWEAVEAFRRLRPDVTLMDLRLPDLSGIDVMINLLTEFPKARIILLTTFEREAEIHRAMAAGAYGYLLKNMPPGQIVSSVRQAHAGKKCVAPELASGLAEHLSDESLSCREVEVLRHVADGNLNREIGKRLFIAEATVKVHLKRIMRKLNAKSRTQAITIAVRRGVLEL